MAFGKMSKEELKEIGLDPDKVVNKDDLTALETKISTSIADTIKNSLADLETRLNKTPENKNEDTENNNNNNRENNNNNNNEEEVNAVDFLNDPMKHVRAESQKQAGAVLLETMKIGADAAYREAFRTLSGFRNETLATEIKAEWDKYPVQFKKNPDLLIKNIHDMVMGRHQDDILRDTNKKEGKYNLVQSGGVSRINDVSLPDKKPEDNLTDEELKAAKSFGMTPKEFADQKGLMKYV